MQIDEFNQKVFRIINGLDLREITNIHNALIEKGFCEKTPDLTETNLKKEIKNAFQRVSIEDLETIVPDKIQDVIAEFKDENGNELISDENQEITQPLQQEETAESLVSEASKIVAQRSTTNSEIPRDLQPRLSYICAKLIHKFSYSQREIAKQINLSRTSISSYDEKYFKEQPDTVKMWIQSVESKVFSRVEETVGKQAATRAIDVLKGNISFGDVVREKYVGIAAARGYNLYDQRHLEKVITQGVSLFFEIEGISQNIMKIERENEILRTQKFSLKKVNADLYNKILILTTEEI